MSTPESPCPCGSSQPYAVCCEPLHQDQAQATSAEQLMRSRYCAYVKQNYPYLLKTWATTSATPTLKDLELSGDQQRWLALHIHETQQGQPGDDEGWVSFSAYFKPQHNGEKQALTALQERSYFRQHNGSWLYVNGDVRETKIKPGRNDPCPCGSGRKFKLCCA